MKHSLLLALLFIISRQLHSQAPGATLTAASNTICTGTSVTFSASTTNSPTSFVWSVTPSFSVTLVPGNGYPGQSISFGRAGTHTVSVLVSNSSGSVTASRVVNVVQSANASFNAQISNSGYPATVALTNFSGNTVGNLWIFNPGGASDNSEHSSQTYTASGSFSITLIAYGAAGCNDTADYRFYIHDSSGVTAPTVFTPNNDNVNDIFRPMARGISQMNVWIYNRFGTLVAQWDKVNGSWDGYTTSGLACPPGVYFYVIEATGFDGRSYKLKNNLTLIR